MLKDNIMFILYNVHLYLYKNTTRICFLEFRAKKI